MPPNMSTPCYINGSYLLFNVVLTVAKLGNLKKFLFDFTCCLPLKSPYRTLVVTAYAFINVLSAILFLPNILDMLNNSYVVPWTTKSEWQDVRKKIYSEKVEDVIEAYETMTMWQMRCENLPAYVDCTAGILQVMVQEYKNDKAVFSDFDLRLSYSTALIRFINHVHSISEHRNDTLYHSAKTQNIPDWMITMRHDAAHGRTLPALETFHLAANISLQWLLENYWVQEEKLFSVMGARHFEDNIMMKNLDLKLLPIYKIAINVWETCCDLMKNSVIFNSDLYEEQLPQIRELIHLCETSDSLKNDGFNCVVWKKKILKFCKKPDNFEPSKNRILRCLKFYLAELLERITNDDTARYAFVEALLQSDFMLDTTQKEWESVIHLVQTLKCFSIFLECLFELAGHENDMAVNLLEILLPSLSVQRSVWSWYKDLLKSDKSKKIPKKKLKKMVLVKLKKQSKKATIQLKLQCPPRITLEMVQKMLSYPTQQCCKVGFEYLGFIKNLKMPQQLYYELEALIDVYFGREEIREDFWEVPDKILTLDDIKSEAEEDTHGDQCLANGENADWRRSEESSETWSSCPLGLLPHQKAVDCNLPEDLKWVPETPSEGRKRLLSIILTSQAKGMKKLKLSLKNIDE